MKRSELGSYLDRGLQSAEVQANYDYKIINIPAHKYTNQITTMGFFGIHPFTYAPNKTTFDGKTDMLKYW
jgi:hypothetical protein